MDFVFSIIKYIFLGFFGLIAVLFLLALLFGKRIVKSWEFEAKFRDDSGREFGEFDIELSRVARKDTQDTFKAKFKLHHDSLEQGQRVQVYLDDDLVMEGSVETAGRVWLTSDHVKTKLDTASSGQVCRVVYGGVERFTQAIIPD